MRITGSRLLRKNRIKLQLIIAILFAALVIPTRAEALGLFS
jgi:cell division protein FtsL